MISETLPVRAASKLPYVVIVIGNGRTGDIVGDYPTHKEAARGIAHWKHNNPDMRYTVATRPAGGR